MDRVSGIKDEQIVKIVSYGFVSDTLPYIKQHKNSQGGFLWEKVLLGMSKDCRSSCANYICLLLKYTYRIKLWS